MSQINVLDKGFVRLVDVMPAENTDAAIVQAARVSYGAGTKTPSDDETLIRYLLRNRHTSPLEMIEWKFHMKLPIFVARQVIRTRTANVNESSGRYSEMTDDFYIPNIENIRQQSTSNKQGGDQPIDENIASRARDLIGMNSHNAYLDYQQLLKYGVSREQARMVLPVNIYTEWYWKVDLHNLFHFLALRCDPHAQWETRQYAQAMLDLIKPIVPMACKAWEDYHPLREGMLLTALEVELIKKAGLNVHFKDTDLPKNGREKLEFKEKLKKLGIMSSFYYDT